MNSDFYNGATFGTVIAIAIFGLVAFLESMDIKSDCNYKYDTSA